MWRSLVRQRSRLLPAPTARVDGQTVVITGGNRGIGYQTALGLLQLGAEVVLACRNEQQAERAAGTLRQRTGGTVHTLTCDLADLPSVAQAAGEISRRFPTVDTLICNAGTWAREPRTTPQGHELMYGTHVLGHALLIQRLLDLEVLVRGGRVILVGGELYQLATDCPATPPYKGAMGAWRAYAASKLGVMWLLAAYTPRHPGLRWFAVHPGTAATGIGSASRRAGGWARWLTLTAEEASRTSLRCAVRGDLPTGYHHNTLGHMRLAKDDPAADMERAQDFLDEVLHHINPYR